VLLPKEEDITRKEEGEKRRYMYGKGGEQVKKRAEGRINVPKENKRQGTKKNRR